MNTRDRQSSQSDLERGARLLQTQLDAPEQIYQRGKDVYESGRAVYQNARAIVLSQAGIIRVRAERPNGIKSSDFDPKANPTPIGTNTYSTSTHEYDASRIQDALSGLTDDPIADAIFLCGDYYAPLSLNFSVSASKVTDESQLVDGINITQRVAKGPKRVTVSFQIERLESDNDRIEDVSATTIRHKGRNGANPTPVYKLTQFLGDLYENDEVFAIENTVLNYEIGISWAFIRDYRFTPMQGTTFGSISMTLQEVNVYDPLLYTNSSNSQNYDTIPTSV